MGNARWRMDSKIDKMAGEIKQVTNKYLIISIARVGTVYAYRLYIFTSVANIIHGYLVGPQTTRGRGTWCPSATFCDRVHDILSSATSTP
jgi:hypothetical protein